MRNRTIVTMIYILSQCKPFGKINQIINLAEKKECNSCSNDFLKNKGLFQIILHTLPAFLNIHSILRKIGSPFVFHGNVLTITKVYWQLSSRMKRQKRMCNENYYQMPSWWYDTDHIIWIKCTWISLPITAISTMIQSNTLGTRGKLSWQISANC